MNKKDLTLFCALAKIATANAEGFTVDVKTLCPVDHGFSVACKGTQNSFGVEGLANVIKYVNNHPEIQAVGGWYNSENKQYYFDATIICDDLNTALELGRVNHQIAIFDLNNMCEIRL